MKTTNCTDSQIKQLRSEAARAGDWKMYAIASCALDRFADAYEVVSDSNRADPIDPAMWSRDEARAECARIIAENEAQS